MARDLTLADVDQAEAKLSEAKKARTSDLAGYQSQAQETSDIRLAYRRQEEAAGRRSGMVAGGQS